jgi:ATP-binding cassette subfamily B protein
VGELGLTLSGGQRQRISIARALYRDPRILVFDEATSALDRISEEAIHKNLDAILAGRTALIVTHSVTTTRHADRILVLQDGAIVEEGTHDELLDERGAYFALISEQVGR